MSYGNRQVYDDVCRIYFSSWYGDLRTRLGVEIEDHTDYTNFRFFTCCCIDQNNTFSYGCHTHAWVQSKGYDVACDAVINGSQWVGDGGWSYIRIDKTHSAQTPVFKAHTTSKTVNGYGGLPSGGNTIAYSPFTVSARPSYSVTYNANGGSGAPSSQTKWYGETLTLSSTAPTRDGYTFQGWATSSGGSVAYKAGASYTGNSSLTLYAVWKANTWTVSYDANGGAGAPASQTKTYGQTLTLSSTKPTRANYTFLGWATSASDTAAEYAAGGSYTANQGAVLYAVWKLAFVAPKISMTTPFRCDSTGAASDTGTQCATQVTWSVDTSVTPSNAATAVKADLVASSGTVEAIDLLSSASNTTGATQTALFATTLAEAGSYSIRATVTDANGLSSVSNAEVPQAFYVMDFNAGGNGVAFGKPSTADGMQVAMNAEFDESIDVSGSATVGGSATVSGASSVNGKLTASGGFSETGSATMTGPSVRISATAQPGVMYIDGAKGGAALNVTKAAGDYAPVIRTNTNGGGAWCVGNYNDENLLFSYTTPENIKSSTNAYSNAFLRANQGGAIPKLATIFSGSYSQTKNQPVTLSDSAANFTLIIVCYKSSDGQYGSTSVYSPNGKTFSATISTTHEGTLWIKSKSYYISGTSINTWSTNNAQSVYWTGEGWLNGSNQCGWNSGDFIGIEKVVGVKW